MRLGCSNKISQTQWFKQQKFIFSVWGCKSKIKVPSALVFGETFPGLQTAAFLLSPHMAFPLCGWGEREISGVPFSSYKDTKPIVLRPYHCDLINLNYVPKNPISKYSHVGVSTSTDELGRVTVHSITHYNTKSHNPLPT